MKSLDIIEVILRTVLAHLCSIVEVFRLETRNTIPLKVLIMPFRTLTFTHLLIQDLPLLTLITLKADPIKKVPPWTRRTTMILDQWLILRTIDTPFSPNVINLIQRTDRASTAL